ncbi:MAG: hypothetical protein KJZ64_00915 [Sphingomonadaceae bacterium]|nr:hypothetical protein [Sphingomonadaceae bacterium]
MDHYNTQGTARSSLKPFLWVGLTCFTLGALIVGYVGMRYQPDLFGLGDDPAAVAAGADQTPAALASATPSPTPSATDAAADAAVERVTEQQGGIEQRLAAAEQRLARLDLQAQAASGNAARAEGLLIAFAARRSLARGAELGYLADQLRLRFGDALPNAVDTIITFSREPVTLDQLVARLDGLAPKLADPAQQGMLDRVRSEVGNLFVIRRESTPSPKPTRRMERARYFLESGRVDRAIDEVRALPGAVNADAWIRDAERYAAAQRALDLIETSAVLEPRRLRDSAGTPVEQPSPAG